MKYFCTLFNLRFLPQGLALHESLKKHCNDFHLYIFAFDDKCYKILKNLNLEYTSIISLSEFEDEELLRVKPTRTLGEYCWTCTSSTILYVLEKYKLDHCTYIDADLYFYSSPDALLNELGDKSVLITEHRFSPNYLQSKSFGKYCVQFITFKNDDNGLEVLKWWRNACIEWCYAKLEDGKFGDQKYLDDWTTRFDGIHELQHMGGGVAPWNVQQYSISKKHNKIYIKQNNQNIKFEVIFYHFHTVKFNEINHITNKSWYKIPKKVEKLIYEPYIKHLRRISKQINSIEVIKPPYKVPSPWEIREIQRNIKRKFYIILKFLLGMKDIKDNI
ncbi:MAG: glycosyl transferase [Candidatus Melainabacteria bacterium RIFOXYA12_FULL_32_12]|nr:MAG: glycosyl transferase [Candidatus Melainabacteria bacterium RIFOXYA2_FULL_32_9]OGI27561.1 MAG: glycosyl transferase [Candidatus Melainabacteria bacterium RIFOXYA12_FULL_32_12]